MFFRTASLLIIAAAATACGSNYSPDTYATSAVQQANKVEQGVIIGVRDVAVSASGAIGAVTGAAAGGLAGSQAGAGPISAFSALGGSLIGGLAGAAAEHVVSDTKAFEYIVRKPNNDLVSVTQKDKVPLEIGQKVLVIAGNQARVVPDYTVGDRSEAQRRPPVGDAPAGAPPDATRPEPSAQAAEPTTTAPPSGSEPVRLTPLPTVENLVAPVSRPDSGS